MWATGLFESVAEHAPCRFKSKTFFVHTKEIVLVLNYEVFSTKIWQFLHLASIKIIRIKCTEQFIMEIHSLLPLLSKRVLA